MDLNSAKKIKIEGMNCNHCAMTVKNTAEKINGVKEVEVVLVDNSAYIQGDFNMDDMKQAIESAGYKVIE